MKTIQHVKLSDGRYGIIINSTARTFAIQIECSEVINFWKKSKKSTSATEALTFEHTVEQTTKNSNVDICNNTLSEAIKGFIKTFELPKTITFSEDVFLDLVVKNEIATISTESILGKLSSNMTSISFKANPGINITGKVSLRDLTKVNQDVIHLPAIIGFDPVTKVLRLLGKPIDVYKTKNYNQ